MQVLQLTALESLDLSNTSLRSLPNTLHALSNLTRLRLASCSFTRLPTAVFSVPSLRHLDLGRNADLSLGDLSRTQLTWLASLGSLNIAKLDDCVWERPCLPTLAFLEAASRQRQLLLRVDAAEASGQIPCKGGQLQREGGWKKRGMGETCVLERCWEGSVSVGVRGANGQLVQICLDIP